MTTDQHETERTVLATHPRMTQRRIEAACEEANNRLTPAFLKIAMHLPRDPAPRFAYTNRRRSSNALPCPSLNLVQLAQRAMIEAIQTGDRTTIEGTAIEIQALGAELTAAMLAPYTATTHVEPSLASEGLAAHKEVTEASNAVAVALVTRSPGDCERALKESIDAQAALRRFDDAARHAATPARRPTPIHAIR